MPTLTSNQLRLFAEQGYIVLPQIISADLIEEARRNVAACALQEPPPADHRGYHFFWIEDERLKNLLAPLCASAAFSLAQSLIAPQIFAPVTQVQISLNIPPWPHRPGAPHVDGFPLLPDGEPGVFTLLAGIFLTDQIEENAGNLWVWPDSFRNIVIHLRKSGADEFLKMGGYPHSQINVGKPHQVTGRAGDVMLAHYLLGHNIGGNLSPNIREVLYYRLTCAGTRGRWRDIVCDPFLEFAPVKKALPSAGT